MGGHALDQFISDHAAQDDGADDGELDVVVGGDQRDGVAQHLHEGGTDDNACDGSLAAAQAASTQDGSGDGVEFVEIAEIDGLRGIDVEHEEQTTETREGRTDDVGEDRHALGVDAAVAGGLLIAAECEQITAVDGAVQEDGGDDGDGHEEKAGGRDGETRDEWDGNLAGGEFPEALELRTKADGLVASESPGDAAVQQQTAQRHDEWRQPELGDEQSVEQPDADGNQCDRGKGGGHGPRLGGEKPRQAAADETDNGADGKVDAAGDDHERNTDADDAEQGAAADEILQVVGTEEAGTGDGGDHADNEQESRDAEDFAHGTKWGNQREDAG